MREKYFGLFLAIFWALAIEVTICQYTSYFSFVKEPENATYRISSGGEENPDGTITITDTPLNLEIYDIGKEVNVLKLNFTRLSGEKEEVTTPVIVYGKDEANDNYFVLSSYREILPESERSQYLRLHMSGKCEGISISIYAAPGEKIRLDELILNAHIPFNISPLRLSVMILTFCFLFYARSEGAYYKIIKADKDNTQKVITALVIALQIFVFCSAVFFNPDFIEVNWRHHMQYHELAVALSKGQLYLEEMPSGILADLSNPYDFVTREKIMNITNQSYIWDCAYYDGKYYVYFGVVPVMLFYLPWYLLTGNAFPTWLGILITGVVFVLAAFRLSENIVKRYFKNSVPYITWLLCTLLMVNGCGVLTIMRRPDFYSLPIFLGVTLSLLGINFWISSLEEEKVSTWKLVAGCLCMALVAGCRPQLVLGSLLIFPIYWEAVFKRRQLFSANSKGKTTLAILAYAFVAAGLMLYNWRRFDSPFDFGAAYNLTTNDMTKRGFELGRIPVALFRYLFQCPNVSGDFPYLQVTSGGTTYLGQTISEGTFGGFLTVNLLALAGIVILFNRKIFTDKKVWAMSAMAVGAAFIIVCADAELAGILPRYYSDFGWLFYLSALLAWFTKWKSRRDSAEGIMVLRKAQNIIFAIGMAFALLLLFTDSSNTLKEANPQLYYYFYYELAFWA